MPFDTSSPADTALISGYPANERTERTFTQTVFTNDHDEESGDHAKVGLEQGGVGGGDEPALDGTLGFVYAQDIGGETELHYKSDAGNVVVLTTAGAVAPLSVLKAGDTMTGVLLMDGGTIDFGNLTEKLRGEVAAGGTFRELAFIDAANKINIGDENEPLWLRADSKGDPSDTPADDDKGFIAVYPGGPDNERFWHEGNDGTGSTLDADLVDGVEAEAIFFDINSNTGSGFFFQSAGQTVAAGDAQAAIAHSLVTLPTLVTAVFKCTSIDLGYSIDDEIVVAAGGQNDNRTIAFGADDTNCFYSLGIQLLRFPDKGTGVIADIDATKWELIIRAWK